MRGVFFSLQAGSAVAWSRLNVGGKTPSHAEAPG